MLRRRAELIAEMLSTLSQAQGLTAARLAELSDLNPGIISDLFAGNRNRRLITYAGKLAKHLGPLVAELTLADEDLFRAYAEFSRKVQQHGAALIVRTRAAVWFRPASMAETGRPVGIVDREASIAWSEILTPANVAREFGLTWDELDEDERGMIETWCVAHLQKTK